MGSVFTCICNQPVTHEKPRSPMRSMQKSPSEVALLDMLCSRDVTLDNFIIEKVIGKGAFAKVWLVKHKNTSKYYAMKTLKKEYIELRNQRDHTENERLILEAAKDHPFITTLRYAFQTADKLYMVIDYNPGGELFYHLKYSGGFKEKTAAFYMAEIILALEFLHKAGILYRDLKPENVLLDAQGHVVLTDFGLSKYGLQEEQKAFSFWGTPEYLAPEIILRAGHDQACDYWCLGVLLYEMLSGNPPFTQRSRQQLYKTITTKPIKPKKSFSIHAQHLIELLTRIDPKTRLADPELIKSHKFFANIDWDLLYKKQLDPPFRPKVRSEIDTGNFEKKFLKLKPIDSFVNSKMSLQGKMDMNYVGFTFSDDLLDEVESNPDANSKQGNLFDRTDYNPDVNTNQQNILNGLDENPAASTQQSNLMDGIEDIPQPNDN